LEKNFNSILIRVREVIKDSNSSTRQIYTFRVNSLLYEVLSYLNTIKKLFDKGIFSDFEDEKDILKWWTSGISKKKYMAMKNQLSIKF